MKNKIFIINISILAVVLAVCFVGANGFTRMHTIDLIVETNPSITEIRMLRDYSSGLVVI